MDYTSASGYVTDEKNRRQYTDRNDALGVQGSFLVAKDRNAVQNELINIIEMAGLVPSADDETQVLAAARIIFAAAERGLAPYSAALAKLIGGYPKYAIVVDAAGVFWVSSADKNMAVPGADKSWSLFFSGYATNTDVPVGIPQPWPQASPPDGWLVCNGATFSAIQYPLLARAYPALSLPDLRGEFIRGWDNGRGIDSGRAILSAQKGSLSTYDDVGTNPSVDCPRGTAAEMGLDAQIGDYSGASLSFTGNVVNQSSFAGSGIVRPRNVAFNYIVRAL